MTVLLAIEQRQCAVADEIFDDAARGEGVDGRNTVVLLAEDMDADLQRAQARVVEAGDVQVAIAAGDEHVGGTVVGRGGLRLSKADRHAHHDVADACVERALEETSPLRQPEVVEGPVQVAARSDRGDLVLEALLLLVRERQVVRVGADPQLLRRSAPNSARMSAAAAATSDEP